MYTNPGQSEVFESHVQSSRVLQNGFSNFWCQDCWTVGN